MKVNEKKRKENYKIRLKDKKSRCFRKGKERKIMKEDEVRNYKEREIMKNEKM